MVVNYELFLFYGFYQLLRAIQIANDINSWQFISIIFENIFEKLKTWKNDKIYYTLKISFVVFLEHKKLLKLLAICAKYVYQGNKYIIHLQINQQYLTCRKFFIFLSNELCILYFLHLKNVFI